MYHYSLQSKGCCWRVWTCSQSWQRRQGWQPVQNNTMAPSITLYFEVTSGGQRFYMLCMERIFNKRTSLNIESNHSYWKGTVILSRYTMILSSNFPMFQCRWWTLWSRHSRRPWCRSAWTASAFPSSQQPCHQLKKHPSMTLIKRPSINKWWSDDDRFLKSSFVLKLVALKKYWLFLTWGPIWARW